MSDPKRLLTSPDADPAVVELLESLRTIAPEPSVSLSTWPAMAAKVAALPVAVAPPTAAPAPLSPGALSGAAKLVTLKWLGIVVAASGGLTAGVLWLRPKAPPPVPRRMTASRVMTSSAPLRAVPPASQDSASAALEPEPVPVKPSASSLASNSRSSRLDAEASLLAKARSALRRGDAHGAQVALSQLQSSFPSGGLMQEREVLTVEVLAANGNLSAAQRRASAFIAAHPSSPYSAQLQRFVPAPE